MTDVKFHIVQPDEQALFERIAHWYFSEWNIPPDQTIQRLQSITSDLSQFQVVLTLQGIPTSTAGVYKHVKLLDKEPRLSIYKKWLALVYTIPEQRGKGFGAMLCTYIQSHSKSLGIEKLHLFTDTAEKLYKRLGWTERERIKVGSRNLLIMENELNSDCKK